MEYFRKNWDVPIQNLSFFNHIPNISNLGEQSMRIVNNHSGSLLVTIVLFLIYMVKRYYDIVRENDKLSEMLAAYESKNEINSLDNSGPGEKI